MTYTRQSFVQRVRGFTLVELVVAMGVIVVVASLTLVAVRQVARNTRQASGVNAVMAALDNARSLAMKENKIIMVAFRAVPEGSQKQRIEAVLAEWTGLTADDPVVGLVDLFQPVDEVLPRQLPEGIQIAAPQYGSITPELDDTWQTGSNLMQIRAGEAPGAVLAVMFAPDGTTLSRNSQTDSNRAFVDFNGDLAQRQGGNDYTYGPGSFPDNANYSDLGFGLTHYHGQVESDDEPYATIAPFLAVFDERDARETLDTSGWTNASLRATQLSNYITERADRIHFNRYTGVAMK